MGVFGIVGSKDAVHPGGNSSISPFWRGSTAWMMVIKIMPCTSIDEGDFVGWDPNDFSILLIQLSYAVHEVAVLHLLYVRAARDSPCFRTRKKRKGAQI